MTLGQKLKQARLEAGLSQRQLCGNTVTRNMLSQIENGSARPSVETLRCFAGRLGKPLSFFLDEGTPEESPIARAREAYSAGGLGQALALLEEMPEPDWEERLLQRLCLLELGAAAIADGRLPYARALLEKAGEIPELYRIPELEHRRLLLLARAGQPDAWAQLPSLDGELLLRAENALNAANYPRAAALLDSMEDRTLPHWQLLRGTVFCKTGAYAQGAECLHRAEEAFPRETAPLLEECCRELGDFRQAYYYACMQKG